jgi:hypothetical protein
VERPEIPLDSRGGFASAIGLLVARAQRSELPINFAKPKKPKPPSDPNKRRLVAAASLAAAFLVGSFVLCYGLLADKQRLVAEARILRDKVDGQLTLLAEDANRIALLDEWNQAGIVWLDELYDLTARFPDPETIRLTSLAGDPVTRSSAQIKRAARPVRNGNGNEEDQDMSVAKLALNGVTTEDDKAVDALNNRFVQDGHYHVAPKQTDPNTGTDKALFPQHFVAHVSIEKQTPDKYTRQLSVTADEDTGRERTDRRRNGGGRPARGGRQ